MERQWLLRVFLVVLVVFLLSVSFAAAQTRDDIRIDIDAPGGFYAGSIVDNRINFCSRTDLAREHMDFSYSSYTWGRLTEKTEDVRIGEGSRTDELVLESDNGHTSLCEPARGNIFEQGHCFLKIRTEKAAEPELFEFDDVCLTQDTVAECFVQWDGPFDWVFWTGSIWNDMGDYRSIFQLPRYMYARCPGSMKCRSGKCVDPSDPEAPAPTEYELRLPAGDFNPTTMTAIGPYSNVMWTMQRYDKTEYYDDTSAPIVNSFLRQILYVNEWTPPFRQDWERRTHLASNKLARGICQLYNPDGEKRQARYDRCTGTETEIEECYLQTNGVIGWMRRSCPTGTYCQEVTTSGGEAVGARCAIPIGKTDADEDGYSLATGDCQPDNPDVNPSAPDNQCIAGEKGQGVDNDCDGIIDDACEADESPATCITRDLTYEGTAPSGKCCGDDLGETWNLFTSSALATNGCFQAATIPVNAANPANLAAGEEWTRDREGTDAIGTAGMYPHNDELELSSGLTYTYIPARQFHGKRMVWEFEYKEGPRWAYMDVFVQGIQNDDRSSMSRIQNTIIYRSEGWSKIRREFDYDVGTAADASGLLIAILKRSLDATPKIRNFRVYPKDVEKVIYVDNQAYGCQAEESLIATQRYNTPAIPSSGVAIPATNMKNRCDVVTSSTGQNFVCDNDGFWKETPDGTTQLRSIGDEVLPAEICFSPPCPPPPSPPEPDYEIISKKQGCCGGNSCWDGMGCVEDGRVALDEDKRRLCVAGEWQTEVLKKDQYNQPSPTKACGDRQCFWNDPSNLVAADDADDECVDNEEFKEDYQCFFGSWRTRTSMLAQQMLQMTDTGERPDIYTLFCDEPERAALNLEHSGPLAGIVRDAIYGAGDPADCGLGIGKPCINNVCVLKFQHDGKEKVAVGMSLNKPIDVRFDEPGKSILHFLPETVSHPSYVEAADHYTLCDGAISKESRGWVYFGCDGPDSVIEGSPAEVWYNPKTKSIIYSPQGVVVGRETPGTRFLNALLNPFDTIVSAIRGWLGFEEREGIETDRREVAKRLKFDRLFIQRDGRQVIRGILQRDDDEPSRDLMAVEYENIPLDVCANLNRIACTDGTDCSCEPTFIQKGSMTSFTPDAWGFMIKVKGAAGLEFADKWDDLTAKTRLDPSVRASGPASDAPSIGFMTPTSTETLTRFLIREVPDEEDIIGYYWMFETRDDKIIGKGARTHEDASNIEHTFPADGTYDVYLNVINKNFAVERAQTTVTIPSSSGGLSTEELSRLIDESDRARLCAELGICFSVTLPALGGP